jgi:hypothetical protein
VRTFFYFPEARNRLGFVRWQPALCTNLCSQQTQMVKAASHDLLVGQKVFSHSENIRLF